MSKEPQQQLPVELVVFDFDQTIISCDSDGFIAALAPGKKFPRELEKYFDEHDWNNYMEHVFEYLFKIGITRKDYENCLNQIPFVDSIPELMQSLAKPPESLRRQFEVIIISDSNTFFITHILQQKNLAHCVAKVFTNAGYFDPSGRLHIRAYHNQNWCKISARNLCKGQILKEYIGKRAAESVHFDRVSYCGDGSNDLCPSLKLSTTDIVFPRVGYPLQSLLAKAKDLRANISPYTTGNDIWRVISNPVHHC